MSNSRTQIMDHLDHALVTNYNFELAHESNSSDYDSSDSILSSKSADESFSDASCSESSCYDSDDNLSLIETIIKTNQNNWYTDVFLKYHTYSLIECYMIGFMWLFLVFFFNCCPGWLF